MPNFLSCLNTHYSRLLAALLLAAPAIANAAPAFTITGISDETIEENTEYSSLIPVPNGAIVGSVTYSLSVPLGALVTPFSCGLDLLELIDIGLNEDASLFSVNPGTGVVSLPPQDFEAPQDKGANNTYRISLFAVDSANNCAYLRWTISVSDQPPVSFSLTGINNKTLYENTAYTSPAPGISGTTNGSVTYSISGPDAALFTVDIASGVVMLAEQDYEIPADTADAGNNTYQVTLTGTDRDKNSASLSWTVSIINLPALNFTLSPVSTSINEHSLWTSPTPSVNGSFWNPLAFTIDGPDKDLFTLNSNGSVTLEPQSFETPADANGDNIYEITLTATDIENTSASTSISVTVLDIPFDPETDDDGDGVINMVEVAEGTDPNNGSSYRDTDNDSIPDAIDSDADNDLLLNMLDTHGPDPYGDNDSDYVPNYLDADDRGDGTPAICTDDNADDICDIGFPLDILFDPDQDSRPSHADIDSDNDLIPDIVETPIDSDMDGQPDHLDRDSDNDGIPDIVESGTYGLDDDADGIADLFDADMSGGLDGNADGIDDAAQPNDHDLDGIPDYLDTDADNDAIPDALEGSTSSDTDLDGIDDAYDADMTGGNDANNDGINDSFPRPNTDNDADPDFLDADSDNDGIPDTVESGAYGSDTNDNDIDDRFDAAISLGVDANGDGVLEDRFPDSDNDGAPDHRDLDSDNDGIPDVTEAGGTDLDENALHDLSSLLALPLPDADTDGMPDYRDTDSNNDGTFDIAGTAFAGLDGNLDGQVDITADPDHDGLDSTADNAPGIYGLKILDTDNDGITDYLDLDKDGDSIGNTEEGAADDDNDLVPNDLDDDSDNDGISDFVESGAPPLTGDTNSNGIDDSVDAGITGGSDTNADGIDDSFAPVDSDGDGIPDYFDQDSDNDGIDDLVETAADNDADGLGNYIDIDSDSDFIPDVKEGIADSDGDLLPDYLDQDSDADTLSDLAEGGTGSVDTDNDGIANRFDVSFTGGPDANSDGIDDDASARDSDGDLLPDYIDIDSDNDRIPDILEAAATDTDGDNTPDYLDTDSDNDGIGDEVESLATGSDSDDDGIDDAFDADIVIAGLDINNDGIVENSRPDTDGDNALDMHDLDSDNDTITDVKESGGLDYDNNGLSDRTSLTSPPLPNVDADSLPDYRDTDSNNDGTFDIAGTAQAGLDTDNNGRVDVTADSDLDGIDDTADTLPLEFGLLAYIDILDLDGDNIANTEEGTTDADGDGIPNRLDHDSDNDGISDLRESGTPAKVGDTNGNGLDDAIDALLTGGTDANADGVDDAYAPVDSDGDGTPDYLDTDADNDNISDLEETGNITLAGADTDGDGIDDAFDVDQTGGVDADGDGIDDAIVLIVDTDNDGTPNHQDTDSDNDGFLDGIENDDTNNDGIPDRLQPEGEVKGSSGGGAAGLPLLLLLGSIAAMRRRFSLAMASCLILLIPGLAQAGEEYVCRDYVLKPGTEKAFQPCFYIGAGLGISTLDPDTDASSWKLADDGDTGFSLYGGYHFARDWFAEMQYTDLGQASLDSQHLLVTAQESIGYSAWSAVAGYYLPLQDWSTTALPFKVYLKAGVAQLGYDASSSLVKLEKDSEIVPALGAGMEFPLLNNRLSIRGGIDSFSAGASYLQVSLAWWFGGKNYHWKPPKPVEPPVEEPVVAVTEAPAPEEKPEEALVEEPKPEEKTAAIQVPSDPDLDGVFDPFDECPDTPPKTRVDRKGCARYTGYIQSLYGAFNSTDLTYPSYGALDTVILLLKTYPDTRIEIQAHTDDRGTTEYNQRLSEQRAQVVKEYLVSKGIAAERIEANGYGESKPLDTSDTDLGRSRNRRIDFKVLGQ